MGNDRAGYYGTVVSNYIVFDFRIYQKKVPCWCVVIKNIDYIYHIKLCGGKSYFLEYALIGVIVYETQRKNFMFWDTVYYFWNDFSNY